MSRKPKHHDAIFQKVEAMVLPILKGNAKRFARQLGMDYPEALQEARLALMIGLQRYDYNASEGGIFNYAKIVVRRHFLKLWAEQATQRRRPHVRIVTEDGRRVAMPVGFVVEQPPLTRGGYLKGLPMSGDFLDTFESVGPSPEDELVASEIDLAAAAFQKALEDELSDRDRQVLTCKVDPPRGLRMLMLDELVTEPTIPLIGRYLGLSKNEIDWAIRRIRDAAMVVIGRRDFSDLGDYSVVQAYVERHL
jgi:RNA polymerase sigma factor (sigma-70 family)